MNYENLKVIALAAGTAACALFVNGCSDSSENKKNEELPEVVAAVPLKKDVVLMDDYTARLAAVESVKVRARVGGYLEKVNFKEGQFVKKGDLLFVIDPRTFEAELASAKARVAEVEARVKLADTNLKRAKELFAADVVSQEVLDTRSCEMLSANAALLSAKAVLRNAQLNLEFAYIRAPISGRISEKLVDIGNLVVANSTVLTTIVKYDTIQAYFELSERDVVNYRDAGLFKQIDIDAGTGPKIELRLFENTDKVRSGVLNYCDNQISPDTATLAMRADFDNADGSLTPGMFGTVSVAGETRKDALLVPESAIGTDLVGRYVMVVDGDGKVSYRHVDVGRLFGKYRIIEKGLSETDRVVVAGLQRAVEGAKVKVKIESVK